MGRFMISGLLHDDHYRMVEDELANIVHQFTTHLHRAEYNQLKNPTSLSFAGDELPQLLKSWQRSAT